MLLHIYNPHNMFHHIRPVQIGSLYHLREDYAYSYYKKRTGLVLMPLFH